MAFSSSPSFSPEAFKKHCHLSDLRDKGKHYSILEIFQCPHIFSSHGFFFVLFCFVQPFVSTILSIQRSMRQYYRMLSSIMSFISSTAPNKHFSKLNNIARELKLSRERKGQGKSQCFQLKVNDNKWQLLRPVLGCEGDTWGSCNLIVCISGEFLRAGSSSRIWKKEFPASSKCRKRRENETEWHFSSSLISWDPTFSHMFLSDWIQLKLKGYSFSYWHKLM